MLAGALIRLRTFQALGKLFTFEASIQREHRLVTSGPYAFVRHPSYTGMIIANPSWFLWHFGKGSFLNATGLGELWWSKALAVMWGMSVMGGTLYLTLGRMQQEDQALKKEFGREWDNYARRVLYSVLPGIY
jgi:protein-S-isoprenylcysteine O-methyltransferase Ste14